METCLKEQIGQRRGKVINPCPFDLDLRLMVFTMQMACFEHPIRNTWRKGERDTRQRALLLLVLVLTGTLMRHAWQWKGAIMPTSRIPIDGGRMEQHPTLHPASAGLARMRHA